MDNFTFRGRSITEFGAVAALGDSMRIGAKIARSEYDMPEGGSVEIGEAVYKTTTRTVTITPEDGRTATPAWRRAILAWLQGGRGELVFEDDPDVVRIAQFDTDGTYEWRSWPSGLLQLTMTLQPHAHAKIMTTASAQTRGGQASLLLAMETEIPTPVTIEARALVGTITSMRIACGKDEVMLEGVNIPEGGEILYRAGDPCGEDAAVAENGVMTFEHVTRWAQIRARGRTEIAVEVTGAQASVTARARCRWPE